MSFCFVLEAKSRNDSLGFIIQFKIVLSMTRCSMSLTVIHDCIRTEFRSVGTSFSYIDLTSLITSIALLRYDSRCCGIISVLSVCPHILSSCLKFSSNPRLDPCLWRSLLSSTNIISIPNISSSCSQSHVLHDSDVSWKAICWHILNIRKWNPWSFVPRPTSPFDEEQRLRSSFS